MSLKKKTKNSIAILDIGASKILCLCAEIDYLHNVKITGIGHQPSEGIGQGGVISDINLLRNKIVTAISVAEKNSNNSIENVFVNFSGNNISSRIEKITINIFGHSITAKDINKIKYIAFEKYNKDETEILQIFTLDYEIDNIKGVTNPKGQSGKKLTALLNIIIAPKTAVINLEKSLEKSQLNISGIVPSIFASAMSVLTEKEQENGTLIFDIGAKNIALAIFSEGKMQYTNSLTIGSNIITQDIKKYYSLTEEEAERVKILEGTISLDRNSKKDDLFNYTTIEDSNNSIDKNILSKIISARMTEIFEFIEQSFERDEKANLLYKKYKSSIVLTGGGANLINITELASKIFEAKVRVAKGNLFESMPIEHQNPQFSTAYGLIKYAITDINNHNLSFKKFYGKKKLSYKIKNMFLYNPISNFFSNFF